MGPGKSSAHPDGTAGKCKAASKCTLDVDDRTVGFGHDGGIGHPIGVQQQVSGMPGGGSAQQGRQVPETPMVMPRMMMPTTAIGGFFLHGDFQTFNIRVVESYLPLVFLSSSLPWYLHFKFLSDRYKNSVAYMC